MPGEKPLDEESGSVRAPVSGAPVAAEMVERRPPSPVTASDLGCSPLKAAASTQPQQEQQLAMEKRVATNEVIQL